MNVTSLNSTVIITSNITSQPKEIDNILEISNWGYFIGLLLMISVNIIPYLYLRFKKYKGSPVNHPL